MILPVHQPEIITDGGPWAEHDMACAVCHTSKAVIDVGTGVFQPCWECQNTGYRLVYKKRWWTKISNNHPPSIRDALRRKR